MPVTEAHSPIDLRAIAQSFVHADEDRAVKRGYLRWFANARRVVDIGCGEGMFLDLLRDAGITALGIDASPSAAAACRAHGHEVASGDAVAMLQEPGDCFDGALVAHVVEHLAPERVAELIRAAANRLAPGARLVLVTPNVRSLIVLEETFWLDPTHVRPFPRLLLERICQAADLHVIASYDDPATVPRRQWWRRWLARWRSLWSGANRSAPMDAVVVAERR
jgi:2-polyprenyl-3-methyl-5-hydroxy-6-metoxy-1,4-benzoquinol methylase